MRLAINACYGGFGLSPKALRRFAELRGRNCFFFQNHPPGQIGLLDLHRYWPISDTEAEQAVFWSAFDVPDPNGLTDWGTHALYARDIARDDPILLQVIDELGEEADGRCAKLKVVEIPDGVAWAIEEYDGNEWVSEEHRTWS